MTADALDTRLQAQRSGAGWTAKCSAHDDHRESLRVGVGQHGRVLLPDRTYRNHLDMTCAMLADENIALRALLVEALGGRAVVPRTGATGAPRTGRPTPAPRSSDPKTETVSRHYRPLGRARSRRAVSHPGGGVTTLTAHVVSGSSSSVRFVPPPTHPMAVARELVKMLYTTSSGELTLRHHRGDFYHWNGSHWPDEDQRDIRGSAYRYLEHAQYQHSEDGPVPFAPTRRKIDDVLDALRAIVLVDSAIDPPTWVTTSTTLRPPRSSRWRTGSCTSPSAPC